VHDFILILNKPQLKKNRQPWPSRGGCSKKG
jgi:hypothetical protein